MRDNKQVLSSKFNMSLGYIPVLISMFLESQGQGVAIFSGLSAGILLIFLNLGRRAKGLPNFILNISTAILALAGITFLIPGDYIPKGELPFTLELSMLLAMVPVFLHRKRFISHYMQKKTKPLQKRLFMQSAESAVVSARILLITAFLHMTVIVIAMLSNFPVAGQTRWVLFTLTPPAVFLLTILFNQIGINYFNHLMKDTKYLPVVNQHGAVIGRKSLSEVHKGCTEEIFPVIRIAITWHGMLYLCPRDSEPFPEDNRIDLPLERHPHYGESLEEGCKKLLESKFEDTKGLSPIFSIRYYFEDRQEKRLIYLYLLDIDDESRLSEDSFKGGKFWRYDQIEQNLGCQYFSPCFEEEYEHLKDIIDIREKYKES